MIGRPDLRIALFLEFTRWRKNGGLFAEGKKIKGREMPPGNSSVLKMRGAKLRGF